MTRPTLFIRLCLLMALSLPGPLLADLTPPLATQRFTLASLDAVSREVMVGNVLSQLPNDFNGEISIVWTHARYAASARAIRSALIQSGVAPYRIQLRHDIGGYREGGSDGIDLYLQHIILRVSECEYHAMNYRFDLHDEMGCALNNTRTRARVNPLQYEFKGE